MRRFSWLFFLFALGTSLASRSFCQQPPGEDDLFLGTFEAQGLRLEIGPGVGPRRYVGAIVVDGRRATLRASRFGERIAGSFDLDGESHSFTASLSGDELSFNSGSVNRSLMRVNKEGSAREPADAWRALRHPMGVSLRYPGDWAIKQLEAGFSLFPPSLGGSESIQVTAVRATGIDDPGDARFLKQADAMVASAAGPQFVRKGNTVPAKDALTRGATLTYESKATADSPLMQARLSVTIVGDWALALLAVLPPENMLGLTPTLDRIFRSVTFKPPIDERLVGTWSRISETDLDPQSTRTVGADTSAVTRSKLVLTLKSDGSATLRHRGKLVPSGAGQFTESDEETIDEGTWSAAAEHLTLTWTGQEPAETTYRLERVEGRFRLIVRTSDKELVFERQRMERSGPL